MMRINLLPTKAARRQGSAQRELLGLGAVLAAVLIAMLAVWAIGESSASDLRSKVAAAKAAVAAQKKDMERVAELKKNAEALESKLGVIEDLKRKKTGPTRVLEEIAKILTVQRKVWLTRLSETDGVLQLEGGAMEHENISDFQNALAKAPFNMFKNVRLTLVSGKTADGVSYLEWKMSMTTNYSAG